jgi:putative oxidoreductase
MPRELSLQRLFSTFANGLPGLGLMLQRTVIGLALVCGTATQVHSKSQALSIGPQIIDAGMGILLLVGLWTPVVGTAVAVRELWIALANSDPWTHVLLATLGATLALIGPGAWSFDARLFGRREIKRLR